MVDEPTRAELSNKFKHLIDRYGIAHSDVHSSSLFKRTSTIDADQMPFGVEKWAPEFPGLMAASV